MRLRPHVQKVCKILGSCQETFYFQEKGGSVQKQLYNVYHTNLSLKASFFFLLLYLSMSFTKIIPMFLLTNSLPPICRHFYKKNFIFNTQISISLNLCGKQTKTKNAYRIVDSCVAINVSYFIISSIILLEFLVALSMLSVIWDQRYKNA